MEKIIFEVEKCHTGFRIWTRDEGMAVNRTNLRPTLDQATEKIGMMIEEYLGTSHATQRTAEELFT